MTEMAALVFTDTGVRLEFYRRGLLNQSNDPRVGSARTNSTSTTLSHALTGANSASVTSLFATLAPVTVYAIVCFSIFVICRRKYPRVYSPRSFLNSLDPHELSPELPSGWFNWIIPLFKLPDTIVLNKSSLDGFLFLRFIKVLCMICFVGCCITWPVLFPLHALGGGGNTELNLLTIGNVAHPSWYYVHAFLAWIFFGFIIYMVSRECVFYINLRQAYLLSPYYAKRLSSRTVLFTCVPRQVLDERKLRKIFGDSVRNIWIPRDTEDLDQLVKERDQTAYRLEKAEIKLIKLANKERNKAVKNGHPDIETNIGNDTEGDSKKDPIATVTPGSINSPTDSVTPQSPALKWGDNGYGLAGPPPDINGSVASQWIPHSWRPVHRPLANYGRRVDTIKWTRTRLKELAPKINKLRKAQRTGKGEPIPAAFIEFETQVDAQSAYQTLAHHRPCHMTAHINGIRPQEIVWPSLRMTWWELIIRKFLINGAIAAMVIFWSIPAALIGIVSNIDFLSTKVPFLHWINHLPSSILGFISGLLPAVAISCLMATVPYIVRACARQAGTPSHSKVELFTQNAYFVFQVVQVFLITTLTSAASAAFTQILEDPIEAKSLLSQNLPKASNFYVSYFILQGLAMSATRIVHVPSIFRYYVFNSAENPRLLIKKWHRLRLMHWGSIFPVFTNMGVIAISYSCIAPLTLGFAGIGLYFVYVAYHYNLIYVYDSEIDTRGLLYPRALKQILTGVYMAEICLIGLFGLRSAFGPVIIMLGLGIFTFLVHMSLDSALNPLLYNLPKTLTVDELYREHPEMEAKFKEATDLENGTTSLTPNAYHLPGELSEEEDEHDDEHGEQTARAIEGGEAAAKLTLSVTKSALKSQITNFLPINTILKRIDFWTPWISPDSTKKPNFLIRWLHPEIFSDYSILRQMVPPNFPDPVYDDKEARDAYYPPSVRAPVPKLWIPRDVAGVSTQEVAHTGRVIEITDEGLRLDENSLVVVEDLGKGPVMVDRIRF